MEMKETFEPAGAEVPADAPDPAIPDSVPASVPASRTTFKMELSFDGTAYHGWQRQPNGITVQEVVEEKLYRLFGERELIRIQGSSRTDAGVHALGMVCSFSAPPSPYIPDWKLKKAMNRLLPDDIRVRSAEVVKEGFNARFDALAKSYVYVVNTGDINPFSGRYSWHMEDMTETDALREAVKHVEGRHDFSTFTVERGKIDDPVRTILRAEIITFGPLVCMYFLGTGFLYKMVRSMVGALMFVGRGRMAPNEFRGILLACDRAKCKDTAPARGLFLKRVFYEPDAWLDDLPSRPPFWIA
jgi:tRNA pseudouridine38-40 synthase